MLIPFCRAGKSTSALCAAASLLTLLLTLTPGIGAQQSNAAEPDFSNVKDILQGRRTLLSVNDLLIGGTVLKTSDGTKIEDKNISELPGYKTVPGNPEAVARLTNSETGVLVYLDEKIVHAIDLRSKEAKSLNLNEFSSLAALAYGDFRLDGIQELVLATRSGVRLLSAVDPGNFSKGLQAGPKANALSYPLVSPSIAVGDFNGDGYPEIAVAYESLLDMRGRLDIYEVDRQTLAPQLKFSQTFTEADPPLAGVNLAAGRFSTSLHDQLLLSFFTTTHLVSFKSFDFDKSLAPELKNTQALNGANTQAVDLQTGRFAPISPLNQVAAKLTYGRQNIQVGIITMNDELEIRLPTFVALPNVACSIGGLAVGNFARTEPVPEDPSKTQRSLKYQLAISTSDCASTLGVNIYDVNPPASSAQPFVVDPTAVLSRDLTQTRDRNLPIVSADIQGRSVVLGEPVKLVIENSEQPSVIAAMPPMHLDFITAADDSNPTLLNLSAVPDGFFTTYETKATDGVQSSSTNTTSFSFGAEVSSAASVEIGSVENGLGIEVGATASAAQNVKQNNTKEYGSYEGTSFDARVSTGFSDVIWYSDSRFNVYVYPVVGQSVCPPDKKDCDDNEKVPLTIQFSAPDKTERTQTDGALVPWYQPTWEPGNVFSYPANYEQLQQLIPNIELLSKAQTYSTDSNTAAAQATWTKQATDGSSAGIDQNYSFEVGLSVSGAVGGTFVTGKASASLNLSGSSAFSDFNQSVTTVGKSTGIGIEKPGTFRSPPDYRYPFTPYIFGQNKPGSVVDEQPTPADVSTFGMLRTAFTADPAGKAGSWWTHAYSSQPDIALNHPSRWSRLAAAPSSVLPSNCLPSEKGTDCFELSASRPDRPWESTFHVMRGFFISNALSAGKGPQLTTATAGDKLRLEARVYNYSFTPMTDDEVHVRFYAQQIDVNNKHRPIGDSVLINEVILPPIPPFSDRAGDKPNWMLAKTDFNTTDYDSKYLIFWVVVWIQDGNGGLVREVRDHGLTEIPGELKSLAEVKAETYTNNVGLYNSVFYVFPEAPLRQAVDVNAEPATIQIAKAHPFQERAFRNSTLDITADLKAENRSASGVTALFYDGNPHDGGTVFGLERVPYIEEGGTYQVEAPYRPAACGKHEIFAVVHQGTPDEILALLGRVKVDCPGSW